jgi:hypothetical protein
MQSNKKRFGAVPERVEPRPSLQEAPAPILLRHGSGLRRRRHLTLAAALRERRREAFGRAEPARPIFRERIHVGFAGLDASIAALQLGTARGRRSMIEMKLKDALIAPA